MNLERLLGVLLVLTLVFTFAVKVKFNVALDTGWHGLRRIYVHSAIPTFDADEDSRRNLGGRYIVSRSGLSCSEGTCTTTVAGKALMVKLGRIGWSSCTATYDGQSVECRDNAYLGMPYGQEPTVKLNSVVSGGSVFDAAVPLSLYHNAVSLAFMAWLALVPLSAAVLLKRLWPRLQSWPHQLVATAGTLVCVPLGLWVIYWLTFFFVLYSVGVDS